MTKVSKPTANNWFAKAADPSFADLQAWHPAIGYQQLEIPVVKVQNEI